MELVKGEYVRQSDGNRFSYVVDYTPALWRARVTNADGDVVGTPQIGVHGKMLEGEDLKTNVTGWIEKAIRDRVGVL